MNISSNILATALAGCGKTTWLTREMEKYRNDGKQTLYLSFNRKIRMEIRRKYPRERNVHTFHSLVVIDLMVKGFMNARPENNSAELMDKERLIVDDINENHNGSAADYLQSAQDEDGEESADAFHNLVSVWLKLSANSQFSSYKYILVDEFQDVRGDTLNILRALMKLNEKNGVKLVCVGDPYQDIYKFVEPESLDFEEKMGLFGSYEQKALTRSYRCSPSILRFMNGFYGKNYPSPRFYKVDGPYSDDVFLHAIQHKRLLEDKVRDIVALYPEKKFMILGRVSDELDSLKKAFWEYDNVEVSTIHKAKGRETDIAIIVNTYYNDTLSKEEDRNVWNVALTRAREKIHIVTSFYGPKIANLFEEGTFEKDFTQVTYRGHTPRKLKKQQLRLRRREFGKSTIDSLVLYLLLKDAPHVPFEKQNMKKKNKYMKDTRIDSNGFTYVIHKHNSRLTFDFVDLNRLKKEGFTDEEILDFLLDKVREYFSYMLPDDELGNIRVRRVDLARVIEGGAVGHVARVRDMLSLSKYSDSVAKTRLVEGEDGSLTAYLNCTRTSSRKKRTVRAYLSDKKRVNRMEDNGTLKIEIEKHFVGTKEKDPFTAIELRAASRGKGLEHMLDAWMQDEFPFLFEGRSKRHDILTERYSIRTVKDAINAIRDGNISNKMKQFLFFTILENEDPDTARVLRQAFGLSPTNEDTRTARRTSIHPRMERK